MNDLINRQAALDTVRQLQTYKLSEGDSMILVDKADVQTELMLLPSAGSERKKGDWLVLSGKCTKNIDKQVLTIKINKYNTTNY